MGAGWIYLKTLIDQGVFLKGTAKVLDIGFQALYDIPRDEGIEFALSHGYEGPKNFLNTDVMPFVERSAQRQLHLYDFFNFVGIDYTSYEIFDGPNTRIFDLNFDSIAEDHREYFDVVLNFGTTEHVFNQYNCFKVIHEAAKKGACIFHQVPMTGFINHGYWTYSPRTFLELAQANDYEVMECWVCGPAGSDYLPKVVDGVSWDEKRLPAIYKSHWDAMPVPNGLINIMLKKITNGPFRISLDTSTSIAQATKSIVQNYS